MEYAAHFTIFFSILIHRYECPAGCLDATGKVVGTVYYEMVSTQVIQIMLFDWVGSVPIFGQYYAN